MLALPLLRKQRLGWNEKLRGLQLNFGEFFSMSDRIDYGGSQVKKRLSSFLTSAGYLLDSPPADVHRRLAAAMGRARHKEFLDTADAAISGAIPRASLYAAPQSMEEANLLLSFQGALVRGVNCQLFKRLVDIERKTHVIELGCWTGVFTAFMATEFPSVQFTGVDGADNAVRFARAGWALPNLTFETWDYSRAPIEECGKANVLLGAFPIDFDEHIEALDSAYRPHAPFETLSSFRARVDEALPYFKNWYQAAYSDATLVVTLRLPSLERTAAVL